MTVSKYHRAAEAFRDKPGIVEPFWWQKAECDSDSAKAMQDDSLSTAERNVAEKKFIRYFCRPCKVWLACLGDAVKVGDKHTPYVRGGQPHLEVKKYIEAYEALPPAEEAPTIEQLSQQS